MNDQARSVLTTVLEEGAWSVRQWPGDAAAETVHSALGRVTDLGDRVQGIAYTTSGAMSVHTATPELTTRLDGRDQPIPLDSVYELRLWAVIDGRADDGLLAHELRWLNGSGTAEIRVGGQELLSANGDAGWQTTRCWTRSNSYLQHGATAPFDEPSKAMTSVEVFTEEPTYGNTVFVDEIMTGRWS
ncbi:MULTISPECIES: hypothetical protein [Actinomyces]|uniref:Uncharacterized protein n=1 Tax=Actinomyces glycerinitolerans TaxID=1892869 RepID=A0A1M4RZM2_9ACTO|nr:MULTISPECIES: hypothetical protein [Actinomyces]RAX24204.1 hypothetical protein DRB07_01950 [Actinomyces sp. Z3]SHE25392.1 Hypothetical protein ACGLYG10_1608 [Actinomyces glycerinitolerans]